MQLMATFALRKNGSNIMVQVQYTGPLDYETPGMTQTTWNYLTQRELEVVFSVLPQIEFGRTNWVYVVRVHGQGYQLIYKDRPPPTLVTDMWVPLVDVNEIEVHRWVSWDYGDGTWKGQDVRFRYAWCNHFDGLLDILSEYDALHRLQDLDVTYPILGLITLEGRVTGFVQERYHGRGVLYRDRAIVYEAVAKIQRAGFLLLDLNPGYTLITEDNKVRFVGLEGSLAFYPLDDPEAVEDLEQEVEHYHWAKLREIFDELKEWPDDLVCPVRRQTETWMIFPATMYKIPDFYWGIVLMGLPDWHEIPHNFRRDIARLLTTRSQERAKAKRKQKLRLIASSDVKEDNLEDQPMVVSKRKPSRSSVRLPDPWVQVQGRPVRRDNPSKRNVLAPSIHNIFKVAYHKKEVTRAHEELLDSSRFEEILD
ncbi:hypothetical protein NEOLEDRAFT_762993 [Neolentinus lepideus HHB14362 ss-1]|uniref:Uncharacterized protein n=1 Tax=Neolentinus lepideus HHB14362 ss-1 TaxID=1314782 RepID=A0A165PP46_9AGAM|nr:hypothetical protein NEOLEDRAFT_762993 [Neolentinus lepideus HHB14362 ss-1]